MPRQWTQRTTPDFYGTEGGGKTPQKTMDSLSKAAQEPQGENPYPRTRTQPDRNESCNPERQSRRLHGHSNHLQPDQFIPAHRRHGQTATRVFEKVLMEAWRVAPWIPYEGAVAALNVSTERWQLRPFPDNLVAIRGYREDVDPKPPAGIHYDENYIYYRYGGGYSTVPAPPTCRNLSCAILIEGCGAATVGPANSEIVGLAHGLTVLMIVLAAAVAAIGSRWVVLDDIKIVSWDSEQPEDAYYPPSGRSTQRRPPFINDPPQRPRLRLPRPSSLDLDPSLDHYYARPPKPTMRRPVAAGVWTNDEASERSREVV